MSVQGSLSLHAGEAGESEGKMVNPNMTKYIGASLIVGFSIMLLLDQGFLIVKEWRLNNSPLSQHGTPSHEHNHHGHSHSHSNHHTPKKHNHQSNERHHDHEHHHDHHEHEEHAHHHEKGHSHKHKPSKVYIK